MKIKLEQGCADNKWRTVFFSWLAVLIFLSLMDLVCLLFIIDTRGLLGLKAVAGVFVTVSILPIYLILFQLLPDAWDHWTRWLNHSKK